MPICRIITRTAASTAGQCLKWCLSRLAILAMFFTRSFSISCKRRLAHERHTHA
jgi:hypothetical protein